MDDVLISVIEQFRQLSWAIRALIASYYQQIGPNLAVEDGSSVVNRESQVRFIESDTTGLVSNLLSW